MKSSLSLGYLFSIVSNVKEGVEYVADVVADICGVTQHRYIFTNKYRYEMYLEDSVKFHKELTENTIPNSKNKENAKILKEQP